jgi:PKD repeat protein
VTNYTLNGTNYRAHIFTTVGTNSLAVMGGGFVDVLVVAGGGSGGGSQYHGAGGGAGGLIYSNAYPVVSGSNYAIAVGAGGVALIGNATSAGNNGSNSWFGPLLSFGGGGGGNYSAGSIGRNGGSGGGGAGNAGAGTGGIGVSGQGWAGGHGYINSPNHGSGGGGGAGANGVDGTGTSGGNGGNGLYFEAFTNWGDPNNPGWFAGGGGGGTYNGGTSGLGGKGGGGSNTATVGTDGKPNTGGGGGGPRSHISNVSGAGGSGIVIVRYIVGSGGATNQAPTVTASGMPTSGTAPLAVNFTATGADVDGDTLTYAWTFSDSGTAATQNPSHTYAAAGIYPATVTVSDGKGGTASASVTITVSALPTYVVSYNNSESFVGVPEGGTNTFQVRLSSPPTSDVVVAVAWSAGDANLTVTGGASLTFTTNNWSTNQTVTVAAAEDADTVNGTATITCSSPDADSTLVTATEVDNDTTLTVNGGTGGNTTPSGAVVVTMGVAREISATAGAGYAFANWSVTSGAATLANSNAANTTVTLSAPATVQANFSRVAILTSAPFVGVPEGGTAKFRVSLSAQPAGSMTVSVAHGGDSQLSVQSGGSLIFSTSDWSLWKTVTLADAEDGVTNRHVATFTCSSAGMDPVIVTATGIDNDRPVPVDSDGDGLPDALEARLGRVTNALETLTALPFVERFESDTVSLGPLHGQHNWVVNPADAATVQTSQVFEGTRALRIEGTNDSSGTVSQAFTSTAQTVWLDLRITVAGAAVPGSIPDAASVFFFNDAGQLVVCDGARPAGSEWVTLTNTAPRQVGTWARLTASADYVLQTWSLYLDGTNVASNLGFAVPQKRLTCLSMEGPTAVVDNLTVGYGRPDGIPGSSNVAPDDWYLDHFGTLAYSDTDDPDHDGMSNLAEYIAGTDPTDSTSLLKLTEAVTPPANPGEFIIRWQSVTGRVYTLQATTNLMTGFTALTNGLPATPTVNVYTDKVNGVGQKFYRVGVE